MEINKLTAQLLAEGWTAGQTPPGMRPYNKWYGGWEYGPETLRDLVFETPCGLLLRGSEFTGSMGYMGIEWMPENDNPVIACPCFDRRECEQNHPLLRRITMGELRHGGIRQCACHLTDRQYRYEDSARKVWDVNEAEANQFFEEFRAARNGRVCSQHCSYHRWDKRWSMRYEPQRCHDCQGFCPVLQRELDRRKGNVYYDVKTSWTVPAQGLYPAERKTSIVKGVRLLDKAKSITICEVIAKVCRREIQRKEEMRRHRDMFFDPSISVEVINIRAERRETRDLMQDLRDIADGIEVVHKSDSIKQAAQAKRERKTKAAEDRRRRLAKKIAEGTVDERDKYRVARMFDPLEIQQIKKAAQKAEIKRDAPPEQTALW